MQDDKQAALDARVAAVIDEDNVSESLTACGQYPQLEGRALSKFESDCRDWGLLYGITFGLAKADQDGEPNELIADRAYKVARARFANWAGEVEDPAITRERAVRNVINELAKAQERAHNAGRYRDREMMMTSDLYEALGELEIVMGGQA